MTDVLTEITSSMRAVNREHERGTDLEKALIKVARDQGLSLEKARRVTEGMNTANMLRLLRSGEDRTAEFPVADSRRVVQELVALEKKAFAPHVEINTEYLVDDQKHFVPYQQRLLMKKAEAYLFGAAPAEYPKNIPFVVQKAVASMRAMEKQSAELELRRDSLRTELLYGMQKLAGMLVHQNFYQFGKEAEQLHGRREAFPYLSMLERMVPYRLRGNPEHVKTAALVEARTPSHELFTRLLKVASSHAGVTAEGIALAGQLADHKVRLVTLLKKAAKGSPLLKRDREDILHELRGGEDPYGAEPLPTLNVTTPEPGFWERRKATQEAASAEEARAAEESLKGREKAVTEGQRLAKIEKGEAGLRGTESATKWYSEEEKAIKARESLRTTKRDETGFGRKLWESIPGAYAATQLAPKLPAAIAALVEYGTPGGGTDLTEYYARPERSYGSRMKDTMRTQAAIQYVLNYDPILKDRDPSALMPIMQTLLSISPELAKYPPVLASVLRQASAGHAEALDPLTLEQYAQSGLAAVKSRLVQEHLAKGTLPPGVLKL